MRKIMLSTMAAAAAILPGVASAAVTISVEAAGVQATTLVSPAYVETFADAAGDGTDNGTGTPPIATFVSNFGGAPVSGTFTGFELGSPSSYGNGGAQFGGAFGSEQYGVVHGTASITLSRSVRYLGLWAAALDGNNTIELLSNGVSLGQFQLVNEIGQLGSAYFGNPNNGANTGEPYAFVNFLSDEGFDEVRFLQSGGGFEFDNVTVGAVVPEPATWGLMLMGFGLTGAALRRRRSALVAA